MILSSGVPVEKAVAKSTTLNRKVHWPMAMFHRCFMATLIMSMPPLDPRVRSMTPLPAPNMTPPSTAAYISFCRGMVKFMSRRILPAAEVTTVP